MIRFFSLKLKVFDDKKSLIHFALGVITPFLFPYSLIIPAAYVWYQAREKEDIGSKVGDFIEYCVGLIAGLVLHVLWP